MKKPVTADHNKVNDEQAASRAGDAIPHPMQRKIDGSSRQRVQQDRLTQLQEAAVPEKSNGLPSPLRTGIEALSGKDMGDVVVHRNSDKPAQLSALAYAQGNEIHLGPGQEKHLPHESWHVVQQKQGRVKPSFQMKAGLGVNDDRTLEAEADVMAAKLGASHAVSGGSRGVGKAAQLSVEASRSPVIELAYPETPSASVPVQLLAIANVVVFNFGDGQGAKVAAINFAERVPTTVSGAQGDHGVAEVLIHESIASLKGKSVPEFLNGLYARVDANLEGLEIARHTSQVGETFEIKKTKLLGKIAQLITNLGATPPENLQYLLSELTTMYWRLLEKRDMTAFERSEGVTAGGGQEKAGIDGLRNIKARLHSRRGEDIDYTADDALANAVGYTPLLLDLIAHEFENEDLGTLVYRAARHVAEYFEIDEENFDAFVEGLASHIGYDFQVLKGEEKDGYFGLAAEGNTVDMREASEIRKFANWDDVRYSILHQGELIQVTGVPEIATRVFRVTTYYDPSFYERPPDVPPVEWINR